MLPFHGTGFTSLTPICHENPADSGGTNPASSDGSVIRSPTVQALRRGLKFGFCLLRWDSTMTSDLAPLDPATAKEMYLEA